MSFQISKIPAEVYVKQESALAPTTVEGAVLARSEKEVTEKQQCIVAPTIVEETEQVLPVVKMEVIEKQEIVLAPASAEEPPLGLERGSLIGEVGRKRRKIAEEYTEYELMNGANVFGCDDDVMCEEDTDDEYVAVKCVGCERAALRRGGDIIGGVCLHCNGPVRSCVDRVCCRYDVGYKDIIPMTHLMDIPSPGYASAVRHAIGESGTVLDIPIYVRNICGRNKLEDCLVCEPPALVNIWYYESAGRVCITPKWWPMLNAMSGARIGAHNCTIHVSSLLLTGEGTVWSTYGPAQQWAVVVLWMTKADGISTVVKERVVKHYQAKEQLELQAMPDFGRLWGDLGLSDLLHNFVATVLDFLGQTAKLGKEGFNFVGDTLRSMVDGIVRLKNRTTKGVMDFIRDFTGYKKVCALLETFKFMLRQLFMLLVRLAVEYPPEFIMLEFGLAVTMEIGSHVIIPSFTDYLRLEGPSGFPIHVFMSGLLWFLGHRANVNMKSVTEFCNLARSVSYIIPDNIGELVRYVPILNTFIDARTPLGEMIEKSCPHTTHWREKCMEAREKETLYGADGIKVWDEKNYRMAYAMYVNEAKTFTAATQQYWRAYADQLRAPDWISAKVAMSTPQPEVICLYGDAGVGKSTSTEVILRALLVFCAEKGYVHKDTTYDEFAWTLASACKHFDGYRGQPVIVLNDFLSEVEMPGKDGVARHLLALADVAPYFAPFASLSDKGICVAPIFMIVSTNVDWTLWHSQLKQASFPKAFERRITYFYEVRARQYDPVKGQLIVDPKRGADQADFYLRGDRTNLDKVTNIHSIRDVIYAACKGVESYFEKMKKPLDRANMDQFAKMLGKKKNAFIVPVGITDPKVIKEKLDASNKAMRKFAERKPRDKVVVRGKAKPPVARQVGPSPQRNVAGGNKVATFPDKRPDNAGEAPKKDEGQDGDVQLEMMLRPFRFRRQRSTILDLDDMSILEQHVMEDLGVVSEVLSEGKVEQKEEEVSTDEDEDQEWARSPGSPPCFDSEIQFEPEGEWIASRMEDGSVTYDEAMSEYQDELVFHDGPLENVKEESRIKWFMEGFRNPITCVRELCVALYKGPNVAKPDDLFREAGFRCVACRHLPDIPPEICCPICAQKANKDKPEWKDFYPEHKEFRFVDAEDMRTLLLSQGITKVNGFVDYEAIDSVDSPQVYRLAAAGLILTGLIGITVAAFLKLRKKPVSVPDGPADKIVVAGEEWSRRVVDVGGNKQEIYARVQEATPVSKIYAEQLKNPFVRSLKDLLNDDNQRVQEQIPALVKSVVSLFDPSGVLITRAFAISNNELITVKHAKHALSEGFIMKYDKQSRFLQNTEGCTEFAIAETEDLDLAYIYLWKTVTGLRDHVSKFTPDVVQYPGMQVIRVSESGVTKTLQVSEVTKIAASGLDGPVRVVRVASSGTSLGDCGCIYYNTDAGADGCQIVGLHSAADGKSAMFTPVTQRDIYRLRKQLNVPGPLRTIQMQAKMTQPVPSYLTGMDIIGSVPREAAFPRNSSVVPLQGLYEDRDDRWNRKYAPAVMTKMLRTTDGVQRKENVEGYRFRKWTQVTDRKFDLKISIRRAPSTVLSYMSRIARIYKVDPTILHYNDSIVGGEDQKPMPRNKSAGYFYPGFQKDLACDALSEQPKLIKPVLEVLEVLENALASRQSVAFVRSTCLKPEKLPVEKVTEGKTRLFMPDDLHLYLMCRKFFLPVLKWFSRYGRHFGMVIAMTPEEIGRYYQRCDGMIVHTLDQESQDISHNPGCFIDFFKWCLEVGLVANKGSDKQLYDPDLPALDWDARITYGLIRELMFGLFVYKDYIFRSPGALASGCLLTLIINCFTLWKVQCEMVVRYHEFRGTVPGDSMLGGKFVPMMFGDDHKFGFTTQELADEMMVYYRESCEHYGFTMKTENVGAFTDAPFCGRHFEDHVHYGPTMRLAEPRLVKSLQMVTNKSIVSFMNQVVTFIIEATRYNEEDYYYFLGNLYFSGETKFLEVEDNREYCEYAKMCRRVAGSESMSELLDRVGAWLEVASRRISFGDRLSSAAVELQMFKSGTMDKVPMEEEPMSNEEESMTHEQVMEETQPGEEMTAKTRITDVEVDSYNMREGERFRDQVMEEAPTNQYWTRPMLIGEVNWRSTDAVNISLFKVDMPSAYYDNNPNAQAKLFNTVGGVVGVRIMITVFSTYLQIGRLMITGSPMAYVPGDVHVASTGPHAILSAGAKSEAVLDIPFNREISWMRSDAYSTASEKKMMDFVTVNCLVMNALASTAATSARVQIWASLLDARIMQGGLTGWNVAPQAFGMNRGTKESALSVSSRMLSTLHGCVKSANGAVSSVMDMMGMSKPASEVAPSQIREQFGYGMMHGIGVDNAQSFALTQGAGIVPHPGTFPETTGDPMNVEHIGRRPLLIDQIQITPMTTGIVGQYVADVGIVKDNGIGIQTHKSPGTHVAAMHAYNRFRNMVFTFVFSKASGHTGQLEVSADYNGVLDVDTMAKASALHRVIVDLQGLDRFCVVVPYVDPYVWRPYVPRVAGIRHPGLPCLTVRMLTPLVAAPNVAQFIDCNVFIHFEGLQVAFPQMSLSDDPPVVQVVNKKVRLGNVTLEGPYDADEHPMSERVLLCSSELRSVPMKELVGRTIVEETISLSQLIKRFQFHSAVQLVPAAQTTALYKYNGLKPWTPMLQQIIKLFVFGVGGVALKVVRRDDASMELSSYVGVDGEVPYGTPVALSAYAGTTMEVVLPNTTPKFVYPITTDALGMWRTPALRLQIYDPFEAALRLRIYMAMADDAMFGGMNYLGPTYDLPVLTEPQEGDELTTLPPP